MSSTLALLPLETKGHILRYCDARTLGRTSQASLAMLELSGPLLYRDITIRAKRSLKNLIRSETVLPSIAPFVSLTQTRTLTYIPLSGSHELPNLQGTLTSSPVALDLLDIDLREAPIPRDRRRDPSFYLDILLRSVNPQQLHIMGFSCRRTRLGRVLNLPRDPDWSRLRSIRFTNSLSRVTLVSQAFNFLGFWGRRPLLDLTYDLTDMDGSSSTLVEALSRVCMDLQTLQHGYHPGDHNPAFGHVQVWLNDESEVAFARQYLVQCSCTSLDVGVKPTSDA